MARRIGIYNLQLNGDGKGGGEKKSCLLADQLSRRNDVWLISRTEPRREELEAYFGVDLSRVQFFALAGRLLPAARHLSQRVPPSIRRVLNPEYLLDTWEKLAEPGFYSPIRALGLDAFINCQWASILPCPAPCGLYMCMFPQNLRGNIEVDGDAFLTGRIRARISNRLLGMSRNVIDSYTAVTANSTFTRDWVLKRWQITAPVVYSACDQMGTALRKEKIILHVGRFVGEDRDDDKHQAAMLTTYKKLTNLHRDGWQLHFAGSVMPTEKARRQLHQLTEEARGFPVVFHGNAGFRELRDLYRSASIYWHATGLGSPVWKHPQKQEHFGMTTAEAMSAGAVPVVINTGGQRDSVTHDTDGFLWNTLDELADFTLRLAGDPELWQRLSSQAMLSSERFSPEAYAERVEQLL